MFTNAKNEDSDDDCEVYYLRPVNEYNIVDKIKEANRELLQSPARFMESKDRRVKFNERLEEYEPGTIIDDFFEVVDCNEDKPKFTDIKEEAEDDATIQEVEELLLGEIVDRVFPKQESDIEIDEICEEIDDMGFGPKVRPKSASGIRDEPVVSSDETENDKEKDPEEEPTDEEDLLSTLVASYVPENIPTPAKKPPKEKPPPAKTKKQSCFNFGCRKSPNRVDSKTSPTLSLKLNYKTCCEYRNAENQRLPKYMGYLSEYGLTKEQLDAREKKIKVKREKVMEKNLNATKAQIDKMCENEAAFTSWLKNKMKYPVNKTVNMFDYKGSIKQNKIASYCEKEGKKAKSAGPLRRRREKSALLLSV
ncbi:hypothetical protein ACFFRR_004544 [Megaselia abdita]